MTMHRQKDITKRLFVLFSLQHVRNVAWDVAVGFQMQKNEVIMIDNEDLLTPGISGFQAKQCSIIIYFTMLVSSIFFVIEFQVRFPGR